MKKIRKLLAGVLTFAVLMTSGIALASKPVSAASANKVTIFYENDLNWKDCYAYLWQGKGALKGCNAWPGYKMTKVDGTKNWYSYTFTTDSPKFDVIFTDNNGKQTANHTPADLDTTKNAYWFTPTKSTEKNGEYQNGPQGNIVTVYTSAQAGFPKPAAQAATTSSKTDSAAATTAKTSSKTAAQTSPKTGDSGESAVAFFTVTALGALAVLSTVLIKKKVNSK